ncbi:MAG: hypothetical protein M1834_007486 [Cirrosporium novae-zelandiae]|nr:MAG: hypothetical protein M1834_007486 [Cirrosporium novae-zelandiae]
MTPPHQSSSTNNRHNHRHPPPQNQTSLLGYLILLIPLFLFIYPPLSRTFLSQDSSSSKDPSSQSSSSLHTSNGDEVEGQSQNELFPGYAEDDNDDDGDLMLGGGGLKCPEHRFRGVYVYSVEPLVIYLEGFLSEGECDEIIELRTFYKV